MLGLQGYIKKKDVLNMYMAIEDYYKYRDSYKKEKRRDYDRRARKAVKQIIDTLAVFSGIEKDKYDDFVLSKNCLPDEVLKKVFTDETINKIFKIFEKALIISEWDKPLRILEKENIGIGVIHVREKCPIIDLRNGTKIYGPREVTQRGWKIKNGEVEMNFQLFNTEVSLRDSSYREFISTLIKYKAQSKNMGDEYEIFHELMTNYGTFRSMKSRIKENERNLRSSQEENKQFMKFIEKEGLKEKYYLEQNQKIDEEIYKILK
jgi:hypothetical protein